MAFAGCVRLSRVSLPSSVVRLDDLAFAGCSALTALVLPPALREIGAGCFYGCTALSELVIPATVREIGERACAMCTGLTSVTIQAGAPVRVELVLGAGAFPSYTSVTWEVAEQPAADAEAREEASAPLEGPARRQQATSKPVPTLAAASLLRGAWRWARRRTRSPARAAPDGSAALEGSVVRTRTRRHLAWHHTLRRLASAHRVVRRGNAKSAVRAVVQPVRVVEGATVCWV